MEGMKSGIRRAGAAEVFGAGAGCGGLFFWWEIRHSKVAGQNTPVLGWGRYLRRQGVSDWLSNLNFRWACVQSKFAMAATAHKAEPSGPKETDLQETDGALTLPTNHYDKLGETYHDAFFYDTSGRQFAVFAIIDSWLTFFYL